MRFFDHWCSSMALLLLLAAIAVPAKPQLDSTSVPTSSVVGVVGSDVSLPCDVSLPLPDDRILLVLWYRDGLGTPIYSFDARKRPLREGRHWSDTVVLSNRSHFQLGTTSHSNALAHLSLAAVRSEDAGIYRCRVDFKMSPTRNARVNLTVVVPPSVPVIFDEHGTEIGYPVGPYDEGGTLVLTCEASGGHPSPRVTWWRENRLLDATSESFSFGRVRNTLRLPHLSRFDLGMTLTCQASNNNISVPTSATAFIDLRLRPLGIKLEGAKRSYSAERTYELICTSWGARPPAVITWWKGTNQLQFSPQEISDDGNVTTSVLAYVPSADDDGAILACRSEHPLLTHAQEKSLELHVHHAPVIQLEWSNESIFPDSIKEGDDIYLSCKIRAVPWITRLFWRHNGKQITSDVSRGVLIQNQTLLIVKADRHWSGLYTCAASNDDGDGESNVLFLQFQFAPVCKNDGVAIHYVAMNELVDLRCEIESHPKSDIVYHWSFNGTRGFSILPNSNYTVDRLSSYSISYRPINEQGYGTLLCWSQNSVGVQREPCVFQLLPTPDLHKQLNCSINNVTTDSIFIKCNSRRDLDSSLSLFQVTVVDSDNKLIVNSTLHHIEWFRIHNLEAGKNVQVTVCSINKEDVEPVIFNISTLLATGATDRKVYPFRPIVTTSQTSTDEAHPLQLAPFVGYVVGIGLIFISAILTIMLITRLRQKKRNKRHKSGNDSNNKVAVPLRISDTDETYVDLRIKKPRAADEEDKEEDDTRMFDQLGLIPTACARKSICS